MKKVNTEEQIIVENMHEPIIEKKIYDQIQKNYIQRNQKMYIPGEKIKRHLFSGILKCGCCGKNMVQEGGANRKYLCKYSREDNDELHRTIYIEECCDGMRPQKWMDIINSCKPLMNEEQKQISKKRLCSLPKNMKKISELLDESASYIKQSPSNMDVEYHLSDIAE